MAFLSVDHPWILVFGLLGNIMSGMVYLSPVTTFHRICRKKSTEGFQSFPYCVALFSAMQLIYYAIIKTNTYLLITINSVGCVIESVYIVIYLIYAPKKARIYTIKTMLLLNLGLFSAIVLISYFCFNGADRVKVVGWVNMTFSVSVFAAPLSIMRLVIRTKSVEFMPFFLSFFLTMSAIAWFFYGLLLKDIYIAFPNILGFTFGMAQMVLYIVYKDAKKGKEESSLPAQVVIADIAKLSTFVVDVNRIEATEETNEETESNNKRDGDASDEVMNQV